MPSSQTVILAFVKLIYVNTIDSNFTTALKANLQYVCNGWDVLLRKNAADTFWDKEKLFIFQVEARYS